jgi:hypothetical protein
MIALIFSLIVGSSVASPLKFLGVESVESVAPGSYLPRTALDVLQPAGYGYGYPWLGGYPAFSHHYAPGFVAGRHHIIASPFGLNLPFHFPQAGLGSFFQPPKISTVVVGEKAEAVEEEVVQDDLGVDVSQEESDNGSGSLITVADHADSIPSPPSSGGLLGRDPRPRPILPAGIVQATQPKFVHVVFQNPKASPHFPFLHNSKVSPILNEIKSDSAGILRL